MVVYELRDPDEARGWVVQGLWLSRAAAVTAETAARTLAWALEISSAGVALPLVGLVADAGHVALGGESGEARGTMPAVPGWDAGAVREYEDYVLGRLYADLVFHRAADAVLRYQGQDRARALCFLIGQLGQRIGVGGAVLSPAVLRRLIGEPIHEVLAEGWESLASSGLVENLVVHGSQVVSAFRNSGDLLGSEDVIELERGTALAQFGQRVAFRQVLQAAAQMAGRLPRKRPRLISRSHQVATHITDEDIYPVGGFASVSTRGSIESLLHSQLAYMEPEDRPDLFDIKFVRDELLYYSRDENQFLRRRRTFVFALAADLVECRFKDASLPFQRIVLVLAMVVTVVRRWIEWLSDDALRFEFLFLEGDDGAMAPEVSLVEMLLADQIANGTVAVRSTSAENAKACCVDASRRSLCHCLCVSAAGLALAPERTTTAHLVVNGPLPRLAAEDGRTLSPEVEQGVDAWLALPAALVEEWIG